MEMPLKPLTQRDLDELYGALAQHAEPPTKDENGVEWFSLTCLPGTRGHAAYLQSLGLRVSKGGA